MFFEVIGVQAMNDLWYFNQFSVKINVVIKIFNEWMKYELNLTCELYRNKARFPTYIIGLKVMVDFSEYSWLFKKKAGNW